MTRYHLDFIAPARAASGAVTFELPLSGVALIGRSKDAALRLGDDDSKVSGRHALLQVRGGGIHVVDTSSNGTFIDGVRIQTGTLPPGGTLQLGSTALRLRVEVGAERSDDEWTFDASAHTVPLTKEDLVFIPPTPGAPQPVPFNRFGDFELLALLGQGTYGMVFQARVTETGEHCALKLMKPASPAGAENLRRFQREAAIGKSLSHPRVAGFIDAGEVGGIHYLASEYVPGGTLDALAPCQDLRQATRLASQLFEALSYLHDRRITHRDLKPSNVLLTARGADGYHDLKVVDLGFAKAFIADTRTRYQPALTAPESAGGTLRWASPEQVHDFRSFRPSMDLYSDAATIYYLLSGESHIEQTRPLSGLSAEEIQLAYYEQLTSGRRIPIAQRRPDLPAKLAESLDEILTVDPDAREAVGAGVMSVRWGRG